MKIWRKFSRTWVNVARNSSRAVMSISRMACWSDFLASVEIGALRREEVLPLGLLLMLFDREDVDGSERSTSRAQRLGLARSDVVVESHGGLGEHVFEWAAPLRLEPFANRGAAPAEAPCAQLGVVERVRERVRGLVRPRRRRARLLQRSSAAMHAALRRVRGGARVGECCLARFEIHAATSPSARRARDRPAEISENSARSASSARPPPILGLQPALAILRVLQSRLRCASSTCAGAALSRASSCARSARRAACPRPWSLSARSSATALSPRATLFVERVAVRRAPRGDVLPLVLRIVSSSTSRYGALAAAFDLAVMLGRTTRTRAARPRAPRSPSPPRPRRSGASRAQRVGRRASRPARAAFGRCASSMRAASEISARRRSGPGPGALPGEPHCAARVDERGAVFFLRHVAEQRANPRLRRSAASTRSDSASPDSDCSCCEHVHRQQQQRTRVDARMPRANRASRPRDRARGSRARCPRGIARRAFADAAPVDTKSDSGPYDGALAELVAVA